MAGKMQAVVKTKPAPGAEWLTVDVPKIAPDQVLVKVKAASICGTDVHIYKWDPWSEGRIGAKNLPQILGHEVAGEVVEVGGQVSKVKVGDYISAETHIPCKQCIQCLTGQEHICANLSILGVDCHGAFAEYFAVPESVCWINDQTIPPEFATVQEPLGNATYAVLGEDNDVAGKTMAIIGDGPIALFAVGVARASGVTSIFLVGKYDYNMDIGKRMGADHLLYANRDDVDRISFIRDHTYGFGTDIVLDMAGSPQALEEGFKMLRKGGRFTAFGVASVSPTPIDYNNGIVFKGAQVHGINGRKMYDTWFRVRNFLASGRLDIAPVVTHLLPLEDYAKGFEVMMERPRKSAKVILFPDAQEYDQAKARII
ncbi:alcohol dehydrogenase catalytic domain-containing protein [Candidatus Zixiibacteriota bacterium]